MQTLYGPSVGSCSQTLQNEGAATPRLFNFTLILAAIKKTCRFVVWKSLLSSVLFYLLRFTGGITRKM